MGEGHSTAEPAAAAAPELPESPQGGPVQPVAPRRRSVQSRRVVLSDRRGAERHLRVSWHRASNTFVMSTWADQVCTGSVRVPVEQAPQLIGLLADGMGEAVGYAAAPTSGTAASPGVVDRVLGWLGLHRAGRPPARGRTASTAEGSAAQVHRLR